MLLPARSNRCMRKVKATWSLAGDHIQKISLCFVLHQKTASGQHRKCSSPSECLCDRKYWGSRGDWNLTIIFEIKDSLDFLVFCKTFKYHFPPSLSVWRLFTFSQTHSAQIVCFVSERRVSHGMELACQLKQLIKMGILNLWVNLITFCHFCFWNRIMKWSCNETSCLKAADMGELFPPDGLSGLSHCHPQRLTHRLMATTNFARRINLTSSATSSRPHQSVDGRNLDSCGFCVRLLVFQRPEKNIGFLFCAMFIPGNSQWKNTQCVFFSSKISHWEYIEWKYSSRGRHFRQGPSNKGLDG